MLFGFTCPNIFYNLFFVVVPQHIRYHVMEGELEVKDMVNNTVETMFPGDDQSDPRITASFTQYENGGNCF